jgi:hypothetical protein
MVAEGRRIFGNTMKYVLMGTSSNVGNMASAAGASLFLLLPSQILLNNPRTTKASPPVARPYGRHRHLRKRAARFSRIEKNRGTTLSR